MLHFFNLLEKGTKPPVSKYLFHFQVIFLPVFFYSPQPIIFHTCLSVHIEGCLALTPPITPTLCQQAQRSCRCRCQPWGRGYDSHTRCEIWLLAVNFSLGKGAKHPSLSNVVHQDFMTGHLSIWDCFALSKTVRTDWQCYTICMENRTKLAGNCYLKLPDS